LIYLLTLNRWVTLSSLNFVSNLAGWDNSSKHRGRFECGEFVADFSFGAVRNRSGTPSAT
ncbi:MAG: hypothetical protein AB1813_24235, partial [Verrucomicrobiota bacterium]